jgi:hypothetical protein
MWQELAEGKLWLCDNFLSHTELKIVFDEWEKFQKFRTIEQDPDEYYVAPTYYHSKQPLRPPRNRKEIQGFVIPKLNLLYQQMFGEVAPVTDLTYAQFYFKESEPGVSRFDLHCEPGPQSPDHFGHCVFMLYLSDEVDSPIVCPSLIDAAPMMTSIYDESVKNMNVEYVDNTVSVMPKTNRCIVLKNETPHYVPLGTGRRKCITGWSFLGQKLTHIS